MAVVTTAWLTQMLSTKLGVSFGLEMASQLGAILFEKEDLDVRGYDRLIRDEAALKLNEARKETQLALQLAEQNDMGREVKMGLFTLSRQLQRSQERVKLHLSLVMSSLLPLTSLDRDTFSTLTRAWGSDML